MKFYKIGVVLFLIVAVVAGFVFVYPPRGYEAVTLGMFIGALFLVLGSIIATPIIAKATCFYLSAGSWLYSAGAVIGFVNHYHGKWDCLFFVLLFVFLAYICCKTGLATTKGKVQGSKIKIADLLPFSKK